MITKIIKALKENNIDTYRINCTQSKSVELFFIKKQMDMIRSTDVTEYSVTVYRDFLHNDTKMRGHAVTMVFPDMTDEEITRALQDAYYAASFVKNRFYELPEPSTTLPQENKKEYDLKVSAFELAKAIFEADEESKKSFINSAEVFATQKIARVINSRGIDAEFNVYNFNGEFVTQAITETQDVEIHTAFSYNDPDRDQLKAKVSTALATAYDRAEAIKAASAGKYDVILTGENLAMVLRYYTELSQGAMVYAGYSTFKEGCFIQGNEEEIQGERVNITLKATQPYSAEGIAMKDRIMAENGVLKTIHCGKRFADYLGIDATGDYGAFECNCGSENFDEMKNGALYVSVFSDFQMDSYTGQFGGEIRLAYLFEEKDGETVVKKFTGGSINGSIFDVQKTMVFSKERYKDDSYEGPFAVKLKNISIAGE